MVKQALWAQCMFACVALTAECVTGQCRAIQTFERWGPLEEHHHLGSQVATDGKTVAVAGQYTVEWNYAGSVFVMVRDPEYPSGWLVQARLGPIEPPSEFGRAIAIEGDRMLIGDPGDDAKGGSAGAAYIFERNPDKPAEWSQIAKLFAPDGVALARFGLSVALYGDEAIIGSPNQGIYGGGGVYVFRRDAHDPFKWSLFRTITGGDDHDDFGTSMSVSGDDLVVGAPHCCGFDRAHVFRNQNGDWSPSAILTVPNDVQFGSAVSIWGDWIIVGDPESDVGGDDYGAAYLFRRDGDGWSYQKALVPPKQGSDDYYSTSLQITDQIAIVGAPHSSLFGSRAGYVCVFGRDSGGNDNWGVADQFAAVDTLPHDGFGLRVAAASGMALIGAPDHGLDTSNGAVYFFEMACQCPSDCDGNRVMDLFDFLCFTNAFNAGDLVADCDEDGQFDVFDFLCFVNGFNNSCP